MIPNTAFRGFYLVRPFQKPVSHTLLADRN